MANGQKPYSLPLSRRNNFRVVRVVKGIRGALEILNF